MSFRTNPLLSYRPEELAASLYGDISLLKGNGTSTAPLSSIPPKHKPNRVKPTLKTDIKPPLRFSQRSIGLSRKLDQSLSSTSTLLSSSSTAKLQIRNQQSYLTMRPAHDRLSRTGSATSSTRALSSRSHQQVKQSRGLPSHKPTITRTTRTTKPKTTRPHTRSKQSSTSRPSGMSSRLSSMSVTERIKLCELYPLRRSHSQRSFTGRPKDDSEDVQKAVVLKPPSPMYPSPRSTMHNSVRQHMCDSTVTRLHVTLADDAIISKSILTSHSTACTKQMLPSARYSSSSEPPTEEAAQPFDILVESQHSIPSTPTPESDNIIPQHSDVNQQRVLDDDDADVTIELEEQHITPDRQLLPLLPPPPPPLQSHRGNDIDKIPPQRTTVQLELDIGTKQQHGQRTSLYDSTSTVNSQHSPQPVVLSTTTGPSPSPSPCLSPRSHISSSFPKKSNHSQIKTSVPSHSQVGALSRSIDEAPQAIAHAVDDEVMKMTITRMNASDLHPGDNHNEHLKQKRRTLTKGDPATTSASTLEVSLPSHPQVTKSTRKAVTQHARIYGRDNTTPEPGQLEDFTSRLSSQLRAELAGVKVRLRRRLEEAQRKAIHEVEETKRIANAEKDSLVNAARRLATANRLLRASLARPPSPPPPVGPPAVMGELERGRKWASALVSVERARANCTELAALEDATIRALTKCVSCGGSSACLLVFPCGHSICEACGRQAATGSRCCDSGKHFIHRNMELPPRRFGEMAAALSRIGDCVQLTRKGEAVDIQEFM
eukprot:gnl/Dysnectes_brevis/6670_a10522_164.p1 GENE.gnl/Dysnectes_brevis/6670_a10522_164~~gnl/Dysnectes_brevis/6670_a10522_164.p1  ORF type:complete len:771 (-),score=78.92 gnl/Dysnectes_brevis/6670_a10522_164:28-2340(-)